MKYTLIIEAGDGTRMLKIESDFYEGFTEQLHKAEKIEKKYTECLECGTPVLREGEAEVVCGACSGEEPEDEMDDNS
jgi:ribosomal protein S27AE